MLKNYFVVAWRNLRKSKLYSVINIFGLAVGMTVCLLVLTLIRDQNRRDEHHAHAERVYRVTSTVPAFNDEWFARSPGPLGPALKRSAPGVEEVVRLRRQTITPIRQHDTFSLNGLYAEASFFRVFDFPLAAGNPQTALENPYSVVLSRSTAQRLFGRSNPLGQTITIDTTTRDRSIETEVFTVTGVLKETETPSHLAADAYLSFATLSSANSAEDPNSWAKGRPGYIFGYYTYLLLSEQALPATVATQMNRIIAPHAGDRLSADSLALQPLGDIHLQSGPGLHGEMKHSGIIEAGYLYMLGGLALLVLLAAGFNYANLSVARSLTRAREIGVRKTVGAGRGQVALQFLGESVLMALLALPVALALLQALVPFFNSLQMTNLALTPVALTNLLHPPLLLLFVGFSIVVGILAGAYPALHLSRFDPLSVLKRTGAGRGGGPSTFRVRKGLTALQLGMSLCFIISAALLYRQADFMADTDFGFDGADRLIYVNLHDAPPQAFKQQALQLPSVESVSMTSRAPIVGLGRVGMGNLRRPGARTDSVQGGVRAYDYWIDGDYIDNMGLRMIAGMELEKTAFTDGSSVIINEKAARELGFQSPEQAIAALITYKNDNLRVIGVVENYTNMDPDPEPDPLLHRYDPEQHQYALVRARPGAMEDAVSDMEKLWIQFDHAGTLDYGIYEDVIARRTAPMVEGGKAIGIVALLTVLIACLGLLGMASYNVRTRTKEIGMRKALGASVRDIVWLLSKEYLWLAVAASAFALPLAYWINRQWLGNLAHRIDIGWVTPALSMAALVMLVLAVVGTQTVRAALTNPTDSLRSE